MTKDLRIVTSSRVDHRGGRQQFQFTDVTESTSDYHVHGAIPKEGDYSLQIDTISVVPDSFYDVVMNVVEAEKAAQANVIRRREETNATRSLLNTAKVMEANAVALRLKELETLEKVTEKIGTISVYGGLDSVLNDLVRMKQ